MKRQLLSLFKQPQVKRKDLWLTLLGALLWLGATNLRPYIIQTRCAKDVSACSPSRVEGWDQYSLGKNNGTAEDISTDTQVVTGVLAYVVPTALQITRAVMTSSPMADAFFIAGQDALLITQTLVFNGTANEIVRLFVQRPRPYVYGDPSYYGSNFANYTSFYSGHTSFSSAMNTALFLVLLGRAAPLWLLVLAGAGGQAIVVLTGVTRILAGRHFFTDVFWGAVAGLVIAFLVALAHRTDQSAQ
jgi:membrane-associated phospholipid phosphatase